MKSRGNVTVRVDANSEVGLGHLKRCLTLIIQLRIDGFNVQLVGRHRFGKEIKSIIEGIPVFWLEDTEFIINQRLSVETEAWDAEGTLSIIGRYPTEKSWVVVDHYGLGKQWERIIREAGHSVLVIDDFRNRNHYADMLVSDTMGPFDPTLNGNLSGAYELVGPQFTLVDPEFAFSEETSSPVENKKRLLVCYGGSDPTNETVKALRAIHILRNNGQFCERVGKVDVIVGHTNTRKSDVIQSAKEVEDVGIHIAPGSLAPLMREADVLLTAGGNSMVEGLTMRKPCLVTLTNDNQIRMVAQLLEQQAILLLGEYMMVDSRDVAKGVIKILSEYDQFVSNIRARPIFDHLGAHRISAAIQMISENGASNRNNSEIIRNN